MIGAEDLARLQIRRTIFHDVPKRPKEGAGEPVLADLETQVDATRAAMLRRRMVQVLGSRTSYTVQFAPDSGSRVPDDADSSEVDQGSGVKAISIPAIPIR